MALRQLTSRIYCRVGHAAPSLVRHMSLLPEPVHPSPRPDVNYQDLSNIAMKLFSAGLDQVSSVAMVGNALKFNQHDKTLETSHSCYKVNKNIHVVAVGKAVTGMCKAVEDIFGSEIVQAVAVIPDGTLQTLRDAGRGHLIPSSRFEIFTAGDGRKMCGLSLQYANQISHMARKLTAEDILVTLISGGGSSLLTLPKSPLTLDDQIQTVKRMHEHQVAFLDQITVRKNMSEIKGGGLAAMAFPAKVISLILSDFTHDQFTQVGGGLTTPDGSTPQQALEILRKHNLVDKVPPIVIDVLQKEVNQATEKKWLTDHLSLKDIYSGPKPRHNTSNAVNILVGSDKIAVEAIVRQCSVYEMPARACSQRAARPSPRESGRLFACVAQYVASMMTRKGRTDDDKELIHTELECINFGMTKCELKEIARVADNAANMKKPVCLVFSSKISVRVSDKCPGKGGACHEVALATAIELKRRSKEHESLQKCDVRLFSADSDGMDGGSDVAGAIAEAFQGDEVVHGKSAEEYLDEHDTYSFYANLDRGKYQIITGASGTDIQNLQLLMISNKLW